MQKIIIKLVGWLVNLLPQRGFDRLLVKLVQQRAGRLDAAEALRFLFRLDAATYELEGPSAVRYGNGIHPKHRHTNYHDFFVQHVASAERVLDLGCGKGDVAYDIVTKAGATVLGIDLSEENIREAQQRYKHPALEFKVQDVTKLTVDEAFDVVVLSNVLEHLNDRPQFLKTVMEKTKVKKFLIRVPLFERDWRVPMKQELGIEWRLDPDHKTEFTLKSFEDESSEAGLKIEHLEVRWGEIWSKLSVERR